MHFVYILYSESSDRYYIGETPDIENRMTWHNELGTGYTSRHRPWALKKAYPVSARTVALKLERYIKKKKSRAYNERLTSDDGLWEHALRQSAAG